MTAPAPQTNPAPLQQTAPRRVEGRVVRGTRAGPEPLANQWVVLHRVGPDRAGPIDSTRTTADGRFAMSYRATGDSTALYFASTSYGGVAYFTSPFRNPTVRGDEAALTVFDTTSGPVNIKLGGRHVVVGAPGPSGMRPIGEVYDLENDSTVTLVARDSVTPLWRTQLPAAATGFRLNASGELSAGAISRQGTTVGLFAPLSPGIRQLAFTYDLPANAFPLSLPLAGRTGVVEVLVQEPTARVAGVDLREVAPVNTEGRTFRRFIGQDLPANTVVRIEVPRMVGAAREKVYLGVGVALLGAMVVALLVAARRSLPRVRAVAVAPVAEPRSRRLLRGIANLDAAFERTASPDEETRARYETERAALKAQLGEALAEERRPT